jgi:NADPH2:quinone reductase
MKAVRIHAPGGPEAMQIEDLPEPLPAAGQAQVRIEASGVNFIDTYHRSGLYKLALPATLGVEAAGTVTAVGAGVSEVRVGERVAWAGPTGAYAEMAVVPAARLVKLPERVSTRDAAAAMLQGMTAHYLAVSTYPLEPSDTCLVHAAAGGVGLLLCQIARRRGAHVIATVSTAAKAELARGAGADHVIRYDEEDFAAAVARLTGGRGVQVAYDAVGQATYEQSMRSLAPRGMLVLYGQSSGPVPPIDPLRLAEHGSLFLTRPNLAHYVAAREELLARAGEVLGWLADGSLRVRIGLEMPLAEVRAAHQELESRRTTGKVLLIP